MTIDTLLKLTQTRIGEKLAMRERFILMVAHFYDKINFEIIKVAGTNGKGSTSAMLSACLNADGQRVGLFTSPHLLHVKERFRVDEQEIGEQKLEEVSAYIYQWLNEFLKHHGNAFMPSFFEVLILIAIEYFHRKKVEIAIFEAGVGGANDATSLLPNVLALLTSIGLDHAAQLGDTLESVAKDKAGIATRNSTLIIQKSIKPHLKNLIEAHCKTHQVRFETSKNYIQIFETSLYSTETTVVFNHKMLLLKPNLRGNYQKENLNLVIAAWQFLLNQKLVNSIESLEGVAQTKWNARFEIIGNSPTWLVDAAHNVPAFETLIQSLNQISTKKQRILLIGISKEKDYKKIIQLIPEISDTIYITSDFYKAIPIQELKNEILHLKLSNPENGDFPRLIEHLQHQKDKIIVVTGSIFMIGKAREIICT